MRQSRGVHHLLVLAVGTGAVFVLAAVIMWALAGLLRPVIPVGPGSRVLLCIASMVLACFVAAWGFSAVARAVGFVWLAGERARVGRIADLEAEIGEFREVLLQTIPSPEMIRTHLELVKDSPQHLDHWKKRYRLIADYAKKKQRYNWKAYEDACNSV